ncbi:MAG TPA: hypothetical protein VI653_29420 [Steroidobacteraceae bacterium]
MRTKVKTITSEVKLTRILDAFAQELVDASDEEVSAAAAELGMDLQKWSSAFAGITYPARPQLEDFFDLEAVQARLSRDRES